VASNNPKIPNQAAEITCLTRSDLSFDINDISIEELERRLELAVLPVVMERCVTDCGCPNLTTGCTCN
jgi:hypothetical protein